MPFDQFNQWGGGGGECCPRSAHRPPTSILATALILHCHVPVACYLIYQKKKIHALGKVGGGGGGGGGG